MLTLKYKNYGQMPMKAYKLFKTIYDNKDYDAMEKEFRLVAVLCDMPYEKFIEYNIEDIQELYGQFDNEYQIQHTDYKKLKNIKIGDVDYRVVSDIKDFTVAQYIDFQTFAHNGEKFWVEMLSVFLIPKGKKYNDGYDIFDVIQNIDNNMTFETANNLISFFLKKCESSIKGIVTSLTWKIRMMKMLKMNRIVKKQLTEIENKLVEMNRLHGYICSAMLKS